MDNSSGFSRRQKGERGGTLNSHQCELIASYLKTGKLPSFQCLRDHDLFDEDDAPKNKQGKFARFKSWAHRIYIRNTDGELIHKASGKVILPQEKFVSTIMDIHRHCAPDGSFVFMHRSASATFVQFQKTYTVGKRNFGMTEEQVRRIVKSCRSGSCKVLRKRKKRQQKWRSAMNQTETTKIPPQEADTSHNYNKCGTIVTEKQLPPCSDIANTGICDQQYLGRVKNKFLTTKSVAKPLSVLSMHTPIPTAKINPSYQWLISNNNVNNITPEIKNERFPFLQRMNTYQPNILMNQNSGSDCSLALLSSQPLIGVENMQTELCNVNPNLTNISFISNLKSTENSTSKLLSGFPQLSQNICDQKSVNLCVLSLPSPIIGNSTKTIFPPTTVGSVPQNSLTAIMSSAIQIPIVSFKASTDTSHIDSVKLNSKEMTLLSTPPRKNKKMNEKQAAILCTPSPKLSTRGRKKGLPSSGTKRKLREKITDSANNKSRKVNSMKSKTKKSKGKEKRSRPEAKSSERKTLGCRGTDKTVKMNIGSEHTDIQELLQPAQESDHDFIYKHLNRNVTLENIPRESILGTQYCGYQVEDIQSGLGRNTCCASVGDEEMSEKEEITSKVHMNDVPVLKTQNEFSSADQDRKPIRCLPQMPEQGLVPFPSIWTFYKDIVAENYSFARLLLVINDMKKDMKKSYLNDSLAVERLKKKIFYAENLVKKHKAFLDKYQKDFDQ